MIIVTGQKLDLEKCQQEACIVKHKGETFTLPRLDLRSATTSTGPRVTTTSNSQPTSSELGRPYVTTTETAAESYARSSFASSRFLSCYRDNQNKYTSIRYCKRNNGSRFACGTKPVTTSAGLCYKGVKHLLLECGSSSSYLSGGEAKHAGDPLMAQGFTKLETKDPRQAPLGSVIVYDNACSATHTAGHIEVKISETKWVSDFITTQPASEKTRCRPVKAIYYK
jgi:hypothetical protein